MLKPKAKAPHISAFDAMEHHSGGANKIINFYTIFLSLVFLVASPIAVYVTGETDFWHNLFTIFTSPSKLVTDYFALGGLGSTLFNAAICGIAANILINLSVVRINATSFAAYMLVVAHGFYGLNFVNMWPSIIGVFIYCKVMKKHFRDNIHVALFFHGSWPLHQRLPI